MRLLAGVSALLTIGSSATAGQQTTQPTVKQRRFNEYTLAASRPGKTVLAAMVSRYKGGKRSANGAEYAWVDDCRGERLAVLFDSSRVIQEVRVSSRSDDERDKVACAMPPRSSWRTGRNLALGDPAEAVVQLYGKPDSRSPSSRDGQRLELLYYAFDWAGPSVPQVMEVLCTVEQDGEPGRVVEITLAASSL